MFISILGVEELRTLRDSMTLLGTVAALNQQESWASDAAIRIPRLTEEMRGVLFLGLTCVLAKLAGLLDRDLVVIAAVRHFAVGVGCLVIDLFFIKK